MADPVVTAPFRGFGPSGFEDGDAPDPAGHPAGRDLIRQSFTFVRGRPDLVLSSRAIEARCAAYVPARNTT